jgi:hypothetical protein
MQVVATPTFPGKVKWDNEGKALSKMQVYNNR